MITKDEKTQAHNDVDQIFENILTKFGLRQRKEQIELTHIMLETMFEGTISLLEAGTGIGKTYAYLIASIVFDKYRIRSGERRQPIVVSTATIALQKALHDEYIPFLSQTLFHEGYINEPILSVIRKGKNRYVCDKRLRTRLKNVDFKKKNTKNMQALFSLKEHIDMDEVSHLSGYDRRQVAVPRYCNCPEECRYRRYLENCKSEKYLFHICNHNLLLANAMKNDNGGIHTSLPNYCALTIDEAHTLPSAARQMFGWTLGYDDILSLMNGLRVEHFPLAAHNFGVGMKPILKGMAAETDEETNSFEKNRDKLFEQGHKTLLTIKRVIGSELSRQTYLELIHMISTLDLFLNHKRNIIIYTEKDERHHPIICAAAADISSQMNRALWSRRLPILLTSGTLAVGRDFFKFKSEACLMQNDRSKEFVSLSPFDYEHNCILFVPYSAPAYQKEDLDNYYEAVTKMIVELLRISYGHALILFNSYSAMSAIRDLLENYNIPQQIFVMSRNNPYITKEFKESKNGILLAVGAAWEGMDFPGDLVSMLIIPRLPFPIPDAFSDYQREKFQTVKDFIREVALPDMQIKLRQGFGRAVRLETDTCVVAILDERALRGRRYYHAVRETLPNMPVTGSLRNVKHFLHTVKGAKYFAEVQDE